MRLLKLKILLLVSVFTISLNAFELSKEGAKNITPECIKDIKNYVRDENATLTKCNMLTDKDISKISMMRAFHLKGIIPKNYLP